MPQFISEIVTAYHDLDGKLIGIGTFTIKTKPLGIRGLLGLSLLLQRFPYQTGSKPSFKLFIEYQRLDKAVVPFHHSVTATINGDERYLYFTNAPEGPIVNKPVTDLVSKNGVHEYYLTLHTEGAQQVHRLIVRFNAVNDEEITMKSLGWGGTLLAAITGGAIGTLLTWWFL